MSYDPGKAGMVRVVNQHEQLYSLDSFTGEGSYLVNLKHGTCNCPHFTNRLAHLPASDPARCCKHLTAVKVQAPFLKAAAKAKKLSEKQLVDALQKHGTNPVVGGALRAERQRRQAEAAREQELKAVFA